MTLDETDQTPTVLVVDDDESTRLLATHTLGQAGFRVVEAKDGAEALGLVRRQAPDAILLDVEMPELDGYETCERIRAMPASHQIPIVMITGHDDTESIEKAYSVGATDFATKPVIWTILQHRLRYILRASDTLKALGASRNHLARSQHIARLGSWEWNPATGSLLWSEEVYRLLGATRQDGTPTWKTLLARTCENERERVESWLDELAKIGDNTILTHLIRDANGEERTLHHQVEVEYGARGTVEKLSGTIQDITERVRAENRIHRLAYFDSLTGLPNREAFRKRSEHMLASAARGKHLLALLYLDLDDFKRVNDTLGHSTGDQLLTAVAQRIIDTVRMNDQVSRVSTRREGEGETAARLGGDEFAILLGEIEHGEQAGYAAARLIEELSRPFVLDGQEVFTTTSVGIALYPRDGTDVELLMKHADMAMYAAKRSGKNAFRFFDETMNKAAERRLELDRGLRRALSESELVLVYQPQMDLATGRIDAVEALLRWPHPELGMIGPEEFIPLAEETGLIIPIGEWVLRTACSQARAWKESGVSITRMAVNISAVQFVQPDFTDCIARILKDTGLDPDCLELEITETLLANDVERAIATLSVLKDMGVHLSIDDFGTGYSSLSYLKRFPIDRLKIDQSFVRDITSDPDDAAIAMAVIGMARSMSLSVIAEGVENEGQVQFLKDKQCDEVQGYFLSHPLPPEMLEPLLRQPQRSEVARMTEAPGPRGLLVVDDDTDVLKSLVRALRPDNYQIYTATSAEKGFDILARYGAGVVVADHMMPEMTGTEFLERVRKLYPHTVRIMLSGRSDMNSLVNAVNAGSIYKFLEKPASNDLLRKTVRDAFLILESGEEQVEIGVRQA